MKALVYVHAGTVAEAAVAEELVTLANAITPRPDVVASGIASTAVVEIAREHGAGWVGTAGALELWQTDAATDVLYAALGERGGDVVLGAQRRFERDALARVAARDGRLALGDCVGVDGRALRFQGASGDVSLEIDRPMVITVVPWSVRPMRAPGECVVQALPMPEGAATCGPEVAGEPAGQRPTPDLRHADVVVAGGRGLLRPENVRLLERLADRLPGAALGATAAIVTDEWAPKTQLVGKTGARIEPHVYVAVGISGSFFHEANTRASRYLLTINRDEHAVLPERADLCLVGDAAELVTALTAALEQ